MSDRPENSATLTSPSSPSASSKGSTTKQPKIADQITFKNVADLLERISNATTLKTKENYVKRYFENFRRVFKNVYRTLDPSEADQDSIFYLVRILLPTEDKKRPAYGIKGPVLARLFAKALALDEVSSDGKKLLNYKDPVKAKNSAGDLGTVIYSVIEKRQSGRSSEQGPSLSDLNDILDRLAFATQLDEQRKTLQGFLPKLSPLEGKWLARIILKQLGLGLPKSTIFKLVHPQAQELLAKTNDLELVCRQLNDPSATLDESKQVIMFKPFEQMLCGRLLVKYEASENDPKRRKESFGYLPPFPFIAETKFDGERFQMHYDSSREPSDQFRWFSRSRINYTSNFEQTLTRYIAPLIQPSCKSCILDGEMMAWKHSGEGYTHKAHQVDVRHMDTDPLHRPCFVVFDIVYYNGEAIMKRPLVERLRILDSIFTFKEGIVKMSRQKMIRNQEELMRELNEAVANSQEGLIIKDTKSVYEIGTRSNQWLKVKPEYFSEHSVADLDLVILGGYYTDSVRKLGLINHFLVGLLDNTDPGKPGFIPVTKVGSGCLRQSELAQLVKELEPHFERQPNPAHNVIFKGIKRPDFYIDPKKSAVVTIKAMEILPNENVPLKFSLRFSRLLRIRRDKTWRDVMTLKEFYDIQKTYGGSLYGPVTHFRIRTPSSGPPTVQLVASSVRSPSPPKEPLKELPHVAAEVAAPASLFQVKKPRKYRMVPTKMKTPAVNLSPVKTPAKVMRNIFDSRVFCVIGSVGWKKETEKLISEYGGHIVQNPTNDTFAIIAESRSAKVEALMKLKKYDILKYSWLQKCVESRKILDFTPKDAFSLSSETQRKLSKYFDEYGDSYTEYLSPPEVQELLNKVAQTMEMSSASESDDLSTKEVPDLIENVIENELDMPERVKIRKYNFLQGCRIAFACESQWNESELFGLKIQVEFYGGSVVCEADPEATHIIQLPSQASPKRSECQILNGPGVKMPLNWLEECLKRRTILDEPEYCSQGA